MAEFQIQSNLWVPAPIDQVWQFFSYPKNLMQVTPEKFGVRVLHTGLSADGMMISGGIVNVELAPLKGLPALSKWVLEFAELVSEGPHKYFVDVQKSGPFKTWRHEHHFEAGGDSVTGASAGQVYKIKTPGTWVRDNLKYSFDLGPLTEKVNSLVVRPQLVALFEYREKKINELFGNLPTT